MSHLSKTITGAAFALAAFATQAGAVTLTFGADSLTSNPMHTGAAGTVDLSFSDDAGGVLVNATVTNTTGDTSFGDGATESKLTGFGFALVDGASYVSGSFTAGSYLDYAFETGVDAPPNGFLDVAFADNDNWLGGNPNGALPQGMSDSFSFLLSGYTATEMEIAFAEAFSSVDDTLLAILRFQSVNAGAGSDKLVYQPGEDPNPGPAPIPLPAGGLLMLTGLLGLTAARRARK